MKVPFFDLKEQYQQIWQEIEPEIKKVFETCGYVGGDAVRRFEAEMQNYLGVPYAVGCNSGTDALVLALRACNVRAGDEVITTPFSFFATSEAISLVGAVPVFVDIRENDYNIDPQKIGPAISEKTKAILPVHIFGAPCNMDEIMAVARTHHLKVIEDACQAVGSSYKGKKAGSLGDVGCFSFYPTKNLGGCGDGGMVTTGDENLAIALRALHEHGAGENGARAAAILGGAEDEKMADLSEMAADLYNPYKYYNYLIGYNSRLDALQACVLSVKLKYLNRYNENRTHIAEKYCKGLTDRVMLPEYGSDMIPCWHQFVLRTDYKNELSAFLGECGIGSGSFYPVPLHRQKAFRNVQIRVSGGELPVVEKVCSQTVCLPIYPELTEEQTDYVIEQVNAFFEGK